MSRLCLVVTFVLLVPASTFAGPNAGGTLLLHANPSIIYSDGTDYCGQSGLTACDSAVVTLPADPGVPKVFWATAAFPDSSSPRMSVITFGVDYDSTKFAIVEHHQCGDTELPMTTWPSPGSGTAVAWNTAQTDQLRDVYWFRGYRAPRALGGMPM